VAAGAPFSEVVASITEGRKGAVAVLAADGRLAGMVTDGDVRRAFARDVTALVADDIMSPHPITVSPDARMSDAIDLIAANKIGNLFVVEAGRPVAIIHVSELIQAGYVA
jgi:arabinose-5-phosphate isomerase